METYIAAEAAFVPTAVKESKFSQVTDLSGAVALCSSPSEQEELKAMFEMCKALRYCITVSSPRPSI